MLQMCVATSVELQDLKSCLIFKMSSPCHLTRESRPYLAWLSKFARLNVTWNWSLAVLATTQEPLITLHRVSAVVTG